MCGICGELSFAGGPPVSGRVIGAMSDAIAHRGPDHANAYLSADGRAGLGFRRLSIIDLSADGNQPIGNEDQSVQLVFNGEIYNFQELRRGLVSRGHRFRSNADSEVIAHLYEDLGERAIDELDGMFAIALWDQRAGRLLLARDRAGKKPLFVWHDGQRVAFASEIKALAVHPAVTLDVDDAVVPSYFLHGYAPHPRTFYRGISQLEPGTLAVFDRDGRKQERRYWQLTFPPVVATPQPHHHADCVARVRELVTDAVRRRLVSDVPLGAFLSGGLDSTIIVGIMSRLSPTPVRTFSIGFDDDAAFDESAQARETARVFGTTHTEFRVRPAAIDWIDTLIYHHDGPFADSSALPTYLVAKLTREHVTVALTGDGGDEVFAGYLRFAAALAAEKTPAWMAAAAPALDWLPKPRNERHLLSRARRFTRFMRLPLEQRLDAWAGAFYDDAELLLEPWLAGGQRTIDRGRPPLAGVAGASPLSRLLAANFRHYLHDDLLVKADRMSMANSLEARAPFLDRALMEYVAGLPDDDKLRGRTTKAVLREAFDDLVPDAVKRGPKRGFGVPIDAWFRGELRDYCHDLLLAPSAKMRPYVSQGYVRRLVDEHATRRANHGHRLWTLVTFERWLQLLPSWIPAR